MKKVGSLLNLDLDLSLSRSAILQGHFLVISDLLVDDFNITQNGFLGTC
jgi:hypothetical protein